MSTPQRDLTDSPTKESFPIITDHTATPSSTLTTEPFPASRKVYVTGSQPSIRVPMREISLTPTKGPNGATPTPNPPVTVYDPSGPYTDLDVAINVRHGLHPLRQEWTLGRHDVEELPEVTSMYGRKRSTDPSLDAIRFALSRKPLRLINCKKCPKEDAHKRPCHIPPRRGPHVRDPPPHPQSLACFSIMRYMSRDRLV